MADLEGAPVRSAVDESTPFLHPAHSKSRDETGRPRRRGDHPAAGAAVGEVEIDEGRDCRCVSVGSLVYGLLWGGWCGVNVYAVYVGQKNLVGGGACQADALWLTVFGVGWLTLLVTGILWGWLWGMDAKRYPYWVMMFSSMSTCFLFVWMIYGAFRFFSESASSCDPELHRFGFVLSILFLSSPAWGVCLILCLVSSCASWLHLHFGLKP